MTKKEYINFITHAKKADGSECELNEIPDNIQSKGLDGSWYKWNFAVEFIAGFNNVEFRFAPVNGFIPFDKSDKEVIMSKPVIRKGGDEVGICALNDEGLLLIEDNHEDINLMAWQYSLDLLEFADGSVFGKEAV